MKLLHICADSHTENYHLSLLLHLASQMVNSSPLISSAVYNFTSLVTLVDCVVNTNWTKSSSKPTFHKRCTDCDTSSKFKMSLVNIAVSYM